jgi:hypothetical protein
MERKMLKRNISYMEKEIHEMKRELDLLDEKYKEHQELELASGKILEHD